MILQRSYIGKVIEFTSVNCGHVVCKLLSYGNDHVQVELLESIERKRGTWFNGSIHLFDIDKISDIEVVENWKKPEQRRDREVKPRKSKSITFHASEKQRVEGKKKRSEKSIRLAEGYEKRKTVIAETNEARIRRTMFKFNSENE